MNEELFERLSSDEIGLRVSDLVRIFEKVRPHSPSDLCAWLVAHELDRTIAREHRETRRKKEDLGQLTETQIRQLQQLGIYQLADLSRHQANLLIENIAERLSRTTEASQV